MTGKGASRAGGKKEAGDGLDGKGFSFFLLFVAFNLVNVLDFVLLFLAQSFALSSHIYT